MSSGLTGTRLNSRPAITSSIAVFGPRRRFRLSSTPAPPRLPLGGFVLLGLAFGQSSGVVNASFSTHYRYTGAAIVSNSAWFIGAGFAQKPLAPTPACHDGDEVTLSQTEGPYFKPSSPERTELFEEGMAGQPIELIGFVLSRACKPLAGALLDFWQADDKGRYAIPQLPHAKYNVWSRGYGLKDSGKTVAVPGKTVNIKAVAATPQEDAEHYPGMYWYSMLKIPGTDQFPGTRT